MKQEERWKQPTHTAGDAGACRNWLSQCLHDQGSARSRSVLPHPPCGGHLSPSQEFTARSFTAVFQQAHCDNACKIKISMIRRSIQLEHVRLTTHALGALPDYFLVDFTTAPIAMLPSSIGEWVSWI